MHHDVHGRLLQVHHPFPQRNDGDDLSVFFKCFLFILGHDLQMLYVLKIRQGQKGIGLPFAGVPVGYGISYLDAGAFCRDVKIHLVLGRVEEIALVTVLAPKVDRHDIL